MRFKRKKTSYRWKLLVFISISVNAFFLIHLILWKWSTKREVSLLEDDDVYSRSDLAKRKKQKKESALTLEDDAMESGLKVKRKKKKQQRIRLQKDELKELLFARIVDLDARQRAEIQSRDSPLPYISPDNVLNDQQPVLKKQQKIPFAKPRKSNLNTKQDFPEDVRTSDTEHSNKNPLAALSPEINDRQDPSFAELRNRFNQREDQDRLISSRMEQIIEKKEPENSTPQRKEEADHNPIMHHGHFVPAHKNRAELKDIPEQKLHENLKWFEDSCKKTPGATSTTTQYCCWRQNNSPAESKARFAMQQKAMAGLFNEFDAYMGKTVTNNSYRCLPSFIIGGTQKSGSTALTGYFLQHPNVRMANRKELHFFDNRRVIEGLQFYLKDFPDSVPGLEHQFITGEATPFYLHSRHACKVISQLFPSTKLVFILRNPIDRSYSEWQMKQRRVDDQLSFFQKMDANASNVYRCLVTYANDTIRIPDCVGRDLSETFGWPKFFSFILNRSVMKMGWLRYFQTIHKCFRFDGTNFDGHAGLSSKLDETSDWEAFIKNEGFISKVQNVSFPLEKFCYPPMETNQPWQHFATKEAEDIQRCFEQQPPNQPSQVVLEWQNNNYDRCFHSVHGIHKDFLQRSLYAIQLYNCLLHMPRENILVIESSALDNNPIETMDRVHKYVGLPPFVYNKTTRAELDEIIDKYYPKFEIMTGWKMDSKYESMSLSLRNSLQKFFFSHNQLLFDLLGETFPWN